LFPRKVLLLKVFVFGRCPANGFARRAARAAPFTLQGLTLRLAAYGRKMPCEAANLRRLRLFSGFFGVFFLRQATQSLADCKPSIIVFFLKQVLTR